MKRVSILLLKHVNLGGLENARQGFLESNNYQLKKGLAPKFQVELVGAGSEVQIDNGLYAIRPQKSINQIQSTDLVVIPPVKGDKIEEAIRDNIDFLPWLIAQYSNGAEVASLCLGAFILGASGLINNKKCVTGDKEDIFCIFRKPNSPKHAYPELKSIFRGYSTGKD